MLNMYGSMSAILYMCREFISSILLATIFLDWAYVYNFG